MIKTDEEYKSSKQALEAAEEALLALKKKVYDSDPELYHVLSEPYIDYITKLSHETRSYLGLVSAEESGIPLWLRIEGPHIGAGDVPISLLSNFLNDLKLGTQRVSQFIDRKTPAGVGRPEEIFRQLTNFRIKVLPGSLRVGMSFPIPTKQARLDDEPFPNLAEEAVKKILLGISWAVGREEADIEELFPEQEERYLVLKEIDKISPQPGGEIDRIEFRGKIVEKDRLLLVAKHSGKIKDAIYQARSPESTELEGEVREIDLDQKRFILRNIPEEQQIDKMAYIHCRFETDSEDEAIRAINKNVKVIGLLYRPTKGKPYMKLERTEILSSR